MEPLEVTEPIQIEDGKHTGEIVRVEARNEPFAYVDFYIKPEGTDFEIKYGCPANISVNTKLGKLLALFAVFKPGDHVDPELVMKGKKVAFMTQMEKASDGNEYVRIVENSIKPAETIETTSTEEGQ
ncbi:hypothetical protein CMI37_30130 [Candidatus Pacearchaeota archaeon]|nr:hypothetical protein [Candidatus Pacearchaeota archaeon]